MVKVTQRRTKQDFAQVMQELVDVHFPQAEKIQVVLDNLNTHTPKHASWLNMAEIEFSVMVGQCLKRRIGHMHTLMTELAAWQTQRNAAKATVRWQFDVQQARTKLGKLYPHLS